MKWFIAKLLFRVIHIENPVVWQIEEQLRTFTADDLQEALTKSAEIGNQFSERGSSEIKGWKARWEFAGVADVFEITEPGNGTLLQTSTVESESAPEYLALQQRRLAYYNAALQKESLV